MKRLSALLLVLAGCQQDPTIVSPPTFERPGDIAFACFDTQEARFVSRTNCAGDPAEERYAPTVLVSQTASGEVGAVDLRLNQTLDADVRVPGFTFIRVGEAPSALIVPDMNPGVTYVASFGSRTVEWLDTADFRPDATVLSGAGAGAVPLPDGPSDMAISEGEDVLFLALPRAGAIMPVRILASGALEMPADTDLVPLDGMVPETVTIGEATGTLTTCEVEGEVQSPRGPMVPDAPVALGEGPTPEALLVDGDTLLVADTSQPIIHRFTIGADGTLTPIEPLSPGVPVRRLAVTPAVPEVVMGAQIETRYLYAIDAVDQSVLVLDYGEGSPNFGSVLPVRVGEGRADRIRLPSDAQSLGVLTPGFPGETCAAATGEESPTQLRGVFVAVGLTDGTFVLVDVVDLDAPCRGATCGGGVEQDEIVAISRHRVRIGDFIRSPVELSGAPSFSLRGSPGTLDEAGLPVSETDPRLLDLGTCPPFMQPVWGLEGAPVICASNDPWLSRDERWTASFEAVRPGATGGLGRLNGTLDMMQADDGFFCRQGVIGGDDIAASTLNEDDPEFGYQGDLLVITSDPPASRVEENDACSAFVDSTDNDRLLPEFRVVSAATGQLRLAYEGVADPALVLACYGDAFFQYEVRVRDAYLVQGTSTGVEHRIIPTAEGCRVDTAGQPFTPGDPTSLRSSFARSGIPYANPHVAFTLDAQQTVADEDTQLRFQLSGSPRDLAADVGRRGNTRRPALVESVVYNPDNERLYALDSNSDGLLEYSLSPIQVEQVFE